MNPSYQVITSDSNTLAHHGVRGQKWGIRRFQNLDGSLTDEGKKRYGSSTKEKRKFSEKIDDSMQKIATKAEKFSDKVEEKAKSVRDKYNEWLRKRRTKKLAEIKEILDELNKPNSLNSKIVDKAKAKQLKQL